MRAVIHVTGKDQVGIIAAVTNRLAENSANILDITQTIFQPDLFTMVMLVDTNEAARPFADLAADLAALGQTMGLVIHAQREDTFQAMHRI
jgi:ACT domain-containing protein